MPVEMRMWRIDGQTPKQLSAATLPTENELHQFLRQDPSLLGTPLLVIGSEIVTPYGKRLDLLAIDAEGNLHVLELKRDRTPREVVSQVLDYGSWVTTLPRDEIIDIAEKELEQPFEAAFEETFGIAPPDDLNGELRLTIIASSLDASSERIVTYLRGFGVPINAVFFTYLEDDDRRYLARSWLATSEEGVAGSSAKSTSKRAAWNGLDWYVSFGGGRAWEDARKYGFVSAGGGKFYTQTIRALPVGARVWVNIPQTGYVGVGVVTGAAMEFADAILDEPGEKLALSDQALIGTYTHSGATTVDDSEWVVPAQWIGTVDEQSAYWEKGLFANQNSACKLRQEFTLDRLTEHFGVHDE
ncbi:MULTISPECIES: hypothetical protein [unclassified Leucobacter]|uniref:hypothetical protein n=1 Tax=unclassified Leucobacter TaxID=2621730 RepID=UPI00165D563F|nr:MULTISPECIES: hypothetical protein [unclassified Leucobacter]MBC9935497.1 hypothetical protein [Leucobacter sp. cx-87]